MELLSQQSAPWTPRVDRYAQVVVNLDSRALDDRLFTYVVPEELADSIEIGSPVLVPFGYQPDITGFVVSLSDTVESGFQLREISDVLDEIPLFDAAYFEFLQWVADYYATPISQVLACALPNHLIQKTRKEVSLVPMLLNTMPVKDPAEQKILRVLQEHKKALTPKYLARSTRLSQKKTTLALNRLKKKGIVSIETVLSGSTVPKTAKWVSQNPTFQGVEQLTRRQQEILEYLQQFPAGRELRQALDDLKAASSTLQRMAQIGAVIVEDREQIRDPLAYFQQQTQQREFVLSNEQQEAVDTVLLGDSGHPYLLYGVTGSGKTEVYLTLAQRTLERGKSVLVMVPEIALTSHIAKRFIHYFGRENIALWHSNLSAGEKADTWRRLRSGDLKILIGARSGLWAPLRNMGLILIDEEHDSSFKQDSPAPRYNAKTLALELAKRTGSQVVMGSATPDMGSFYTANLNRRVLRLSQRFGGRQMADVQVADMRKERMDGNSTPLSRQLQQALEENIERQEQSIILINRRGFYTTIRCAICDHLFMCPDCDVALTYHKPGNQVRCHYCGYENLAPQFCPQCTSINLSHKGMGTQRIEETIEKMLPHARILRLDSDVLQKKNAYQEVFETFSSGGADILIGTQMVAKGLDVGNVTLVGVLNADSTFALPDFKSEERGFQLLTQVAGRAGRGEKAGRVIIQALNPEHKVIQYAKRQDFLGFYAEEIQSRKTLGFPPFSQLFRFIISAEEEIRAKQFSQAVVEHLREFLNQETILEEIPILGPATCAIPRIQGRYRYHALVKNKLGAEGHRLLTQFYRSVKPLEGVNFLLDIDAQSLL